MLIQLKSVPKHQEYEEGQVLLYSLIAISMSITLMSKGESMKNSFWKQYVAFFLLIPLLVWGSISTIGDGKARSVTAHIEAAAIAPTIEQAHDEIGQALKEIESLGWTKGNTSVFSESTGNSLEAWYNRLSLVYDMMSDGDEVSYDQEIGTSGEPIGFKRKPVSMSLVQSQQVLQGMRASLVDEHCNAITPDGLARFPNNRALGGLLGAGVPSFIVGLLLLIKKLDELF